MSQSKAEDYINIGSAGIETLAAMALKRSVMPELEPEIIGRAEVAELLEERLGVSMNQFEKIATALLPFTYPSISHLTYKAMHTFGQMEGEKWVAVVKQEVA